MEVFDTEVRTFKWNFLNDECVFIYSSYSFFNSVSQLTLSDIFPYLSSFVETRHQGRERVMTEKQCCQQDLEAKGKKQALQQQSSSLYQSNESFVIIDQYWYRG